MFKFTPDENKIIDRWIPNMFDFMTMGYAQTLGWAHPDQGDTMTTVMIGGLRTVMNGDFEVFTNDVIQWYWPFELECFHKDGKRKTFPFNMVYTQDRKWKHCNVNPENQWKLSEEVNNVEQEQSKWELAIDASAREKLHSQAFGMRQGHTKLVPRIKPYFEDEVNFRLYDHQRVFAVAVGCARPHEMVDIKICRQSL
jgi:hypothetical protein